jgi:hypothetical protein
VRVEARLTSQDEIAGKMFPGVVGRGRRGERGGLEMNRIDRPRAVAENVDIKSFLSP